MTTIISLPSTVTVLESGFEVTDQSSWDRPLAQRYTTHEAAVKPGTILDYQCTCVGGQNNHAVRVAVYAITITVMGTGEATVVLSGALMFRGRTTMTPVSVGCSTDRGHIAMSPIPCHVTKAPAWVQSALSTLGVIV